MRDLSGVLAKEFDLERIHIKNTIELIDDGSTIPFIARYRKEKTGEMNDQVLAELYERLNYLRALDKRKEEVMSAIREQGKLGTDLEKAIEDAGSLQETEDLYRPYKQKKKTRASAAREKGLAPLAQIMLEQYERNMDMDEIAIPYLDSQKGVQTIQDAVNGAMDIVAEVISDNAGYRKEIRKKMLENSFIDSKGRTNDDTVYRAYYNYRQKASEIPSHRLLAMIRGEKEGVLSLKIETDEENDMGYLRSMLLKYPAGTTTACVSHAAKDAYTRLILPSVSNEVMGVLFEIAAEKAIRIFAQNLKQLLMQPPLKGRSVMGFDPAYRTGCKLAIVDDTGKLLHTAVIYPTPPQNKTEEAKAILKMLIEKYKVDVISIGNGTASKESEIFVAGTIKEIKRKILYTVVNEAGASVYSASKLAACEFPALDVSLRSAVSIARRLQDPLAELVKIDPGSMGIGQYQHDVDQKRLGAELSFIVEACVNSIGVDLNTASPTLLSYISGIGPGLAKNIVEYREKNGKFKDRGELLKVKKLGTKAFEQSAGFLRVTDGKNILDNTAVHPESYPAALKLLSLTGHSIDDVKDGKLAGLGSEFQKGRIASLAEMIGVGIPTMLDITDELSRPGRDIRDDIEHAELSKDLITVDDLKTGMVLAGTVRNVSGFGAFVDIGVHQDGLVHISQLSDRYVKDPMDVVSVGQSVRVRVLEVDTVRKRISLSMKNITGS
jgi:protein Tex